MRTAHALAPRPDHPVQIHYPSSWIVAANPHAALAERAIERWFREIGVIHDDESAERFLRMNVGHYGGMPFPLARPEALELFASMLSLWIFYDDEIEGLGATDEEVLLGALAGRPAAAVSNDSPCVRGFRDLGARFGARMSHAWMTRHAADFARWLLSVREEALLVRRFRGNVGGRGDSRTAPAAIGVEEHMAVRRFNVGLIPVIDWIEVDLGRELPDRIREHAAMHILVEAACRAVAFGNEMYGYTKDRRARWINSVWCAEREDGLGTARAFERIAALHDQAVEEVVLAGGGLLADSRSGEERALVSAWLKRLRWIVAGFAQWHALAPRYGTVHADESDGSRVVLRLVSRD